MGFPQPIEWNGFVNEELPAYVDPKSLPHGFVEYTGEGVKVYMDVGKYLNFDKEIEKVNVQLSKIGRERVKLDKTLKGKFQFRKSPEEVAQRHLDFDEIVAKLTEQLQILEKMKSKS